MEEIRLASHFTITKFNGRCYCCSACKDQKHRRWNIKSLYQAELSYKCKGNEKYIKDVRFEEIQY